MLGKSKATTLAVGLALGTSAALGSISTPAQAAEPSNANAQIPAGSAPLDTEQLTAAYLQTANDLVGGNAPRTTHTRGDVTLVDYQLPGMIFHAAYRDGKAVLLSKSSKPGEVTPNVGYGFGWGGVYIDLDSSEQGAAAGGLVGTITGALCTYLTAGAGCGLALGLATTIVNVAAAHGVCPNGQKLRIWVPSVYVSGCHN